MARGAGTDDEPKRRRMGIGGPGRRRVPSPIALQGAARHSRIVRTMRVVLPSVALLVIGLVMLQAFMYQADDTLKIGFSKMGPAADEQKMVMMRPEFSALFNKNPFTMNAKKAYRDEDAPHRVIMDDFRGDITVKDERWINFASAKAVLDTKAMRAFLGGGIDLFSDLGYELHTQSMKIDLRNGTVTGQTEVAGQGPIGTIRADGFEVMDEGARIRFNDNVRVKLNQLNAKAPSG